MDSNKKADLMRKHTDTFRKEFAVQKPESVIQAYDCTVNGVLNRGTMYVSQNFVCFKPSMGSVTARLPFSKITNITYSGGLLSGTVVVTASTEKKPYEFASFSTTQKEDKECFELLTYLKSNAPSYIDTAVIDNYVKQQQANSEQSQVQLNVNRGLADELLSQAYSAQQQQNRNTDLIMKQGEQIDRIGQTVDNIQNKLDRGDHLLRGVESYRYFAYGFGGKNKKKRHEALEKKGAARPTGTAPPMEIDILYKRQDDSFLQGVLVLEDDHFKVVDPNSDKLIEKNQTYKYTAIEQLVMRARHEHMDVRFKQTNQVKRLRFMSSYLQVITNQIWSRAKKQGAEPPVVFEPNVRKFEYKDDRVCIVPQSSRESQATNSSSNSFARPVTNMKTSNLLDNVDQQTRNDMDYVDDQLDQVRLVTQQLNQDARNMGYELDRQNAKLQSINTQVSGQIQHAQSMNNRLDHQNSKF